MLMENGKLWGWGDNQLGELGLSDTEPRLTPTQINLPGGGTITQVVFDFNTVVALSMSGEVYSWGKNIYFSGNASNAVTKPTLVDLVDAGPVRKIGYSYALTEAGDLYYLINQTKIALTGNVVGTQGRLVGNYRSLLTVLYENQRYQLTHIGEREIDEVDGDEINFEISPIAADNQLDQVWSPALRPGGQLGLHFFKPEGEVSSKRVVNREILESYQAPQFQC